MIADIIISALHNMTIGLIADSQINGNADTTSAIMSQAWLNTLESLSLRLNPSLKNHFETKLRHSLVGHFFGLDDSIGVTRTKSSQIKFVTTRFFAELNINEQILPMLIEQCIDLRAQKKTPFTNMKDEELANVITPTNIQNLIEHIRTFINQSLKNKTELLSFLQENNQKFYEAFMSHFRDLAGPERIDSITHVKNYQNIEEMKKQIEQLKKDKKYLVDSRLQFYEMPVKVRNEPNRVKAGAKLAFCYSHFGNFILMRGSFIALNATNSCPASTQKVREQYADFITEDGLLLKNIHFNSISAAAQFVNYSSENGKTCFKEIRKKPQKFAPNAEGEWEYNISYKQLKK